jgi:alpha-tubulin suppressor-like RCC1 family protein
VAGWGENDHGELGTGQASSSFVLLPVLASLPPGTRITQVAPGCSHSLALTSTGSVLAWGGNFSGELGNGSAGGFSATPAPVKLPTGVTVSTVAAGCGFSMAVSTTGQVYTWGSNVVGELGTGKTGGNAALPGAVSLAPGVRVRTVAAGESHALAVTTTGQVYAWGSNDDGELGNGITNGQPNPTPALVQLPAGTRITAVTAAEHDSLAVTAGGGVLGWGSQSFGSLGNGRDSGTAPRPVHTLVPRGLRVRSIYAGCFHTLAVSSTGLVLAWGDNGNGQLGIGSLRRGESVFPVHVPLPQGGRAVAVGGGCVHSVAVTGRGQVLAWGSGGLLGNGGTTSSPAPVTVQLPAGRFAIGTGGRAIGDFSLALLR